MGCVICEYLFRTFPTLEEGELTRIKSAVVSRHTCAKTAFQLRLNRFLFLGKGLAIHERIPSSIMAAAFESLIAAIYLDGGWEAAREFVVRILKDDISKVSKSTHGENYKSQLQQQSQKAFSQTPTYKMLDEKGPDHSKCFQVAATIGAKAFPPAWGASKKEAEQTAARNALDVINNVVADDDATETPSDETPPAPVAEAIAASVSETVAESSSKPTDESPTEPTTEVTSEVAPTEVAPTEVAPTEAAPTDESPRDDEDLPFGGESS